MLIIQGKVLQRIDRKVKVNDQIKIKNVNSDETYSGVVKFVIDTEEDRIVYIVDCKTSQIHIYVDMCGPNLRELYISYIIYTDNGILRRTSDEYEIFRAVTEDNLLSIFIESGRLVTKETRSIKEERPLTMTDVLKYTNDGCEYDILYISPEGNMIIQEKVSKLERVVNKKDRKLQTALGIRCHNV
ncbi:MAG: hypothetical protein [Caudoviricetes sp.]|nr:MAG: hypothetical protein [Caudoviricetes sp.]